MLHAQRVVYADTNAPKSDPATQRVSGQPGAFTSLKHFPFFMFLPLKAAAPTSPEGGSNILLLEMGISRRLRSLSAAETHGNFQLQHISPIKREVAFSLRSSPIHCLL